MNCRLTISSADREPWTDRSLRRSYGLYHCTFLCIVRTLYRTCTFHRLHQEATIRKIVDIFVFCQNDLSASFVYKKKLQFVSPEEKIHQELASVTGTVTNYKTNDNKSSFSNSESNCSVFFKDFNSSCLKTLFYINFLMANESLYIQ